MKPEIKIFIKTFLIGGLIYTAVISLYDYAKGENFDFPKLVVMFVVMGFVTAFGARWRYLDEKKKSRTN